MNLFTLAGPAALGTRLRQLSDTLLSDAEKVYQLYGINLDTRWFPVFYMLGHKGNAAITELAQDIGQSHPAVSQVVKQMQKVDLLTTSKSPSDARISLISLTNKGRKIYKDLVTQVEDVKSAVEQLFSDSGINLWANLDALDYCLQQKSLYNRVVDVRKTRTLDSIVVKPFTHQYKEEYKALNVAWIEKYWPLEAADYDALDRPEEKIINPGGYIAIALIEEKVVGTCALIKMKESGYELAKMSVKEECRGKGVGDMLGRHVIEVARQRGAKRIYLESNTKLSPAISLYRKLGFKQIENIPSPYERCDIQMELWLK